MLKKLTALFAVVFIGTCALAQMPDTVKIISSEGKVYIGKMLITSATPIKDVIAKLGEPIRKETIGQRERVYAYDNLGISFDTGKNDDKTIEGISFTNIFDNDRKVAKGKYTGVIVIDGYQVNYTTKTEDLKKNTLFKDIVCMSSFCVSNPKDKKSAIIIGYADAYQTEIKQIGVGLTK